MQNKEGIFSFQELSKLKDFCDNCAKEDKKIHEKRKNNPFYTPEEEKPAPVKQKKIPSYQVSNKGIKSTNYKNKINNNRQNNGENMFIKQNFLKNIDDKDINIILNHNPTFKNPSNSSKVKSDSFKNRVNMFEPKK